MKNTNVDFAKLKFAQSDIKSSQKSTDSNAAVMFG